MEIGTVGVMVSQITITLTQLHQVCSHPITFYYVCVMCYVMYFLYFLYFLYFSFFFFFFL